MADPFVGEIRIVGFNFAPVGWAMCNGQFLAISEFEELFQLIGTTYGGDGEQFYALPNLQSRLAVHQGQGPGLSNLVLGETLGSEEITLTSSQIPSHTHSVTAVRGPGTTPGTTPANAVWGSEAKGTPQNTPYTAGTWDDTLAPGAISPAGGSQPHENMPPFLVCNYIICLFGIFPSQN